MARSFVAASSHHLTRSGAALTATPLTLACWTRPNSPAANATIFTQQNNTTSHGWLLRLDAASHLRAQEFDNVSADSTSAGTLTNAAWNHVAGTFNGTTNIAYLNGVAATGAGARTAPVSVNAIDIGREATGVAYWDGDVAFAAIWNVALSALEIALLAANIAPRRVRPQNLVAYYRLDGYSAPEIDLIGQRHLTVTGATVSPSPRIFALWTPTMAIKGGGGITVPANTGQMFQVF